MNVTASVYAHLLDGPLDDALDVFAPSDVAPHVAQPSKAEAQAGANPLN